MVAAERQLAAATADIGVATADLFPRISLTGLIGLTRRPLGDLGAQRVAAATRSAPGSTWPLLDFGRVALAHRRQRGARGAGAWPATSRASPIALEETEGALSGFTRNAAAGRAARQLPPRNAGDAARLARVRFDAGATDFLVVLDAEREVLASRDQLVAAQAARRRRWWPSTARWAAAGPPACATCRRVR